jgi:PAS domain S-box-containing protein
LLRSAAEAATVDRELGSHRGGLTGGPLSPENGVPPASFLEGRDGRPVGAHTTFTRGAMTDIPHELPRRLLDGSPDAILICDRAGVVRYWNASAERVFGFSSAEVLGVSMDLIIPERLRGRHWAGWEGTMGTGVTRYGEGQLLAVPALHKEGRQISVEFSIQLLKDAAGQIEWVVALFRDVTERFAREKALRAQLKATEPKVA